TLQLVVPALRMETTLPGLDPIVFDSGNPDRSDPTLRAEMSKYLGKPVAEVRIDPKGKLVEVKESRFGPANRFEADLPFKLTLPETAPAAGQGWSRTYRVKLDPPQGAGESYEAAQHYSLKGESDGLMVVAMRTELKSLPPAVIEQIPLLPLLPEGEVYFNPKTGRYHGAKLRVEKELVNHQGEGSRYLYQSSYVEGLVVEEK
ncbi:MAG TPA: hypothetical protein VIL46_11505, partial [Gemmataceae bacterium]